VKIESLMAISKCSVVVVQQFGAFPYRLLNQRKKKSAKAKLKKSNWNSQGRSHQKPQMFRLRTVIAALPKRTIFTSSVLRNAAEGAKEGVKEASKPAVQSSCPAGTVLNLKIKKSGTEPVALEDSEYPEWLWSVLDAKAQQATLDTDAAKKAKREMRARNKKKIKMNNFIAQM
jgi:large subunit ribosomal protein L54